MCDSRCVLYVTAKTLPQTVSIVLVAFNAWDLTRRCLEHLLNASSTLKIEVILVDNGSSDGTPERAEQAFPTVTVLRAGVNLGFGRACNLGMAVAQGEFGVFLNNDALLTDEQLSRLLEAYRRLQLNGIYTSRIVDEKGREEASCFRAIGPGKLLTTAFGRLDQATQDSAYTLSHNNNEALEVDWCTGAFMLFPRRIWEDCGGFDENFFMYYEDVDLCLRWQAKGYKCYANTQITIEHTCGGSSTNSIARSKTVDTSQRYFYRKHFGIAGAVQSRLFQILRSGLRFVFHGAMAIAPDQRRDCVLHFNLLVAALTHD